MRRHIAASRLHGDRKLWARLRWSVDTAAMPTWSSALRGLAVPLTATGLDERRLGPWRGASD